jgi:TonB family protein
MLRSLAAIVLAGIPAVSGPAAAQAPDKPTPTFTKEIDKLHYVEGGMLVLLAPNYPKDALARGETATVTVFGTIQTDGRLENVRIEASAPSESFAVAVREAAQLWRMQPRIVPPGCGATETEGKVTIWFEIADGKPKVSYAAIPPAGAARTPAIHIDRKPVRSVAPQYPTKLAADPRTPKSLMQVAYVGVAEDGSVTNVTVAPMLYYREFEPLIALAVRQWKYAPQEQSWCGETTFQLTLE